MAKGKNAQKNWGREWWGRRPMSGTSVSWNKGMKKEKRICHKMERQENKRTIKRDLDL